MMISWNMVEKHYEMTDLLQFEVGSSKIEVNTDKEIINENIIYNKRIQMIREIVRYVHQWLQ